MITIAIDYDGTYTVNPDLWDRFVDDCVDNDIRVVMVTFRGPEFPIDHDPMIEIFYTSGIGKKQYMDNQGIQINIWIDDMPELINYKVV